MLSPSDIEHKVFSKSMRGYNCEEVDEFLDRIILDMQTLITENQKNQMQIENLEQEVKKARDSEIVIKSTIESAKKLMNDISESAEKRAEAIVKNAYLDAEVIKRNAKEEVLRLENDNNRMQQKLQRFRERYKHLLEEELQSVDSRSSDLLSELEFDSRPVPEEIKMQDKTLKEILQEDEPEKTEVQGKTTRDTIVVNEKTVEEMLREDFLKKENPVPTGKVSDETIII